MKSETTDNNDSSTSSNEETRPLPQLGASRKHLRPAATSESDGSGQTMSSVTTSTATTKKKIPTSSYYKRTREEALAYEHNIPNYELFDLETGFMKEKYRRLRSPSPPSGTTVYEVGSGRAYEYIPGCSLMRISPGSQGMYEMRKAAADAGVLPDRLKKTLDSEDKEIEKRKRPAVERRSMISDSDTDTHSVSGTSGSLHRVIPHVMGYRATTESTSDDEIQQRPDETLTSRRDNVRTDVCNCVALVSAESIRIEVDKPGLANEDYENYNYLTADSPTLRYLRVGYRNYLENNISESVHVLTAYTCRSPRLKLYNVYKSISCKNKESSFEQSASIDPTPSDTIGDGGDGGDQAQSTFVRHSQLLLQKTTAVINQYLNVFSTLADFNYTCITPALKGGICNAMVVDKLWTYNFDRQLYLPSYRLLFGDSYTVFAISEIQRLNNKGVRIRYVRFLSTSNTVIYTNRRALFKVGDNQDSAAAVAEHVRRQASTSFKQQSTHQRRENDKHQYAPKVYSSTPHDFIGEEGKCTEIRCHMKPTRQPLDRTVANDIATEAKNPTLIVFKHILEENEPDTILCNIIIEMDLADTVQYM